MKYKNKSILILMAIMLISFTAQANSINLSFSRITGNNTEDIAAQLSAEVSEIELITVHLSDKDITLGANYALFSFMNHADIQSNIAEIYFDNGDDTNQPLANQLFIINSIGGFTNYTDGGKNGISPGNLPAANTLPTIFEATENFGAEANGNPNNGVNSVDDVVGIVVELSNGLDFSDLQQALYDGNLRLGLHVRSIGSAGNSDSFVNKPGPAIISGVPVPAAIWFFGFAVASLLGFNRKH